MTSILSFKDPSLLRDACLVAGEWAAADSGDTIAVDNPSTGAVVDMFPIWGG
jgi:succinate-semialdehyde dehydrogenase / glutarate-semialdehyde dehydrogenase